MQKPFTEADLAVGDWIKYRDVGGLERIAEIRSFYPFGRHGAALIETTLGHVGLSAVVEVRRHTCDRNGPQTRVVDESSDVPEIKRFPSCSVCGKPQPFSETRNSPAADTPRP